MATRQSLHAIRSHAVRSLGIPLLLLVIAQPAGAQTTGQREASLSERLFAGLQTRRPSEQAFVSAVIDTVERGELSENLVDRVFFWSRERASRRSGRRPIIYFQAAMERLASRARVEIETDAERAAGG